MFLPYVPDFTQAQETDVAYNRAVCPFEGEEAPSADIWEERARGSGRNDLAMRANPRTRWKQVRSYR